MNRLPMFLCGVAAGIVLVVLGQEFWRTQEDSDLEHFSQVRDFARESFVRDVSDDELLDLALEGMLSGLDPYSRYYDRSAAGGMRRETRGRYKGIGVVFRQPITNGEVLFALAGAPGHEAGLRVGDKVLAIDGKLLPEYAEDEVRATLGGTDSIELLVEGRDGERRELEITPASVVDPTVRHVRMLDDTRGVGYIALGSFSRETAAEFDNAFEFLRSRGMRGLLLDLRGNHGGVLAAAVEIAQRFVDEGIIVSTEGRGEPEVFRSDTRTATHAGFPVVLLVDEDSASASEVLAGALQDHRACVVVGSPTFGKGMVQTVRTFPERETVAKVTSSYYFSPGRRNFERTATPGREHGIVPDVSIPVTKTERRRVLAFLAGYGPPPEAIPELEAWETETGLELVAEHPRDTQLDGALALFAGRRPGPHASRIAAE